MRHPVAPLLMLYILTCYMATDVVTTLIGVCILGANELNPICAITGFSLFILLKVVASGVCVYIIYKYSIPYTPRVAMYGMAFAIGVYICVCTWNIYCILGRIL